MSKICYFEALTYSEIKDGSMEKLIDICDALNAKLSNNGRISLQDYCLICGVDDNEQMRRETKAAIVLHKIIHFYVSLEQDDNGYYCSVSYVRKD